MTDQARRNLGSFLGLIMGLAYAVVALNINPFLLSDIPLFVPFPGRLSTIIAIGLCGVLVGRLAAWSTRVVYSTIVSAMVGALLSSLVSFYLINANARSQAGIVRITFIYLIPRMVILLGPAWLIQWVISIWKNELKTIHYSIIKMGLPILPLAFIAMFCGLFSIYPDNGRSALNKTAELVKNGLAAESYTQLPAVLLPVDGFLERSKGKYTLQLSDNPGSLPIQLPVTVGGNHGVAVLVRFESGFRFGCAFVESNVEPSCGEY